MILLFVTMLAAPYNVSGTNGLSNCQANLASFDSEWQIYKIGSNYIMKFKNNEIAIGELNKRTGLWVFDHGDKINFHLEVDIRPDKSFDGIVTTTAGNCASEWFVQGRKKYDEKTTLKRD